MTGTRDGSSLEAELWPQFEGPVERMHVLGTGLGSGVLLGTTRAGKPARMHLLRPAPVRIAVAGQAWIASMLVLRAAALGAATVIVTERPAPWTVLVRGVGGSTPFAAVVDPASAGGAVPQATAAQPVLVLSDTTSGGGEATLARAPWQTSVHLLFRVGGAPSVVLDSADLILLPRQPDDEVEQVLDQLRLPLALAGQMARMGDTELLAVTRSRALFVTVQATPTEQALLRQG